MNHSISPKSNVQEQITPDTVQEWLLTRISEQLGIEPDDIDVQTPLDSYGLSSAQAMSIISDGEKLLGCEISPLLLWHYPTIESLSHRLVEEVESSESETFEI